MAAELPLDTDPLPGGDLRRLRLEISPGRLLEHHLLVLVLVEARLERQGSGAGLRSLIASLSMLNLVYLDF